MFFYEVTTKTDTCLETSDCINRNPLSLSDYEESPEATAQLLQWPKGLVNFQFSSFYNNQFYTDLPIFRSMLLIHKDTLKTLDIGYLSHSGAGRLFKASDYPNLESLTLSRWQMQTDLSFSVSDADMLLAPNL
jgi:hypothetical protein